MSTISFLTNLFKKATDHPDYGGGTPPFVDPQQDGSMRPDDNGNRLPPITMPAAQQLPAPEVRPTDLNNQPLPPVNASVDEPVAAPAITPGDYTQSPEYQQYQQNLPVVGPPAAAAPAQLPTIGGDPTASALDDLKRREAEVGTRDYSAGIYRNPETGDTTNNPNKKGYTEVVHAPGKDRAQHWGLGTKIASALAGWYKGGLAGGVQAATDRNYFARERDANEQAQLLPEIGALQQMRGADAGYQQKLADASYTAARPDLIRSETERKALKDASDTQYKQDVISLGQEKAVNLKGYRDQIIDLKSRGADQNDARIKLLEGKIDETIRHNKVAEKQQSINETGRNTRSGNRIAASAQQQTLNRAQRDQIHNDVKKLGRAAVITRMQQAYMKANPNATQEQIDQHLKNIAIPLIDDISQQ